MDRLVRLLIALLRFSLGLCALGLVLAALYVSLGRELVPLVAEYRAEVEAKAREILAAPLRIDRLEGRWRGMAPLLVAHDVTVGEGSDAVRLDQVRVIPDVLGSLLARQPRLASLELDGLQLSLKEEEDGRWHVEGLPLREPGEPLAPEQAIAQLRKISRLSLLNSQVTLEPRDHGPLSLTYVSLTLSSVASRQRLDGRLLLPDGQPVSWQLRTRLRPQGWAATTAELYLSLPQSDWASWLLPSLTKDWKAETLKAGGELWLNWDQGAVQKAVARLHAPELKGAYAKREAVTVQDLALTAYFNRNEQGFDLLVDSLALSLGDTRWGEMRLGVTRQTPENEDERWQVNADRLDLAPLTPLLKALAPLPEKAADVIQGLKARGALRNVQLAYRPTREDAERLHFSANLDRVGFDAYGGAPAAENVSGGIEGNLQQGELRVASENFSLHLDHLFPQPWQYRQASGRLLWTLDDEAFTLAAPYLRVDGEEGKLAGDFLIRLRRDPAEEDYMDLRVGLREGDARYTEKYLPTLSPGLSPELAAWLKSAIRGGAVDEGYFQYQGSVNKGAEDTARSLSLFFKVHDAELAFQPGWPALREARGEVFIEDTGVRVQASDGRLLDSRIETATASVPHAGPDGIPRLFVEGSVTSSLVDGLKILQEAPLGTAETFAGWQGQGPLNGALKLEIPLRKGNKPKVQVDFATQDAQLRVAQANLDLSQLSGAFRFDSEQGLSAPDIRAQVFGRAVRGKAVAEGRGGAAQTRIEARGQVALKSLTDWLAASQPLPLSGELPYQLRLTLDGADSQLRVDSNLNGLAIDLPAPFGKKASEVRDTTWRMTLQGNERRYWLDHAELASLAFAAPAGQLAEGRGELRLGPGAASLPGGKGLRVRGRIDELDWSAWQTVAKQYRSEQGNAQQLLRSADLRIGRFQGFGTDIADLGVQLVRTDAAWQLDLDSALIKGRVGLPDSAEASLQVALEHLRLPKAEPQEAEQPDAPDPLANMDPHQIPAMDVRIAQVSQGDALLGAWSLKSRPNEKGVRFSELNLNLKGLKIQGDAGWEGVPGNASSWYKGRLEGANLGDVLLAWGFAPTATSEKFHLDVDGRWQGSPAWVSLKRFSGSLDASLRKGQFVEVQGSASALRVFGLLNFNSIGRRLRLDFSDLLGKGLSYDRVKGVLVASEGVYVTREPITLTGPSSNLELDGTLDMVRDRIDAKLVVTLPVTNNLPLAALIVGAPAIGGALFVVDKLLGDKVARFASVQYKVEGPWQDPAITFDKPFEKPR